MRKNISSLTHSRVKEILHYDEDSGQFLRKVAVGRNTKVGDVAGAVSGNGYVILSVDGAQVYGHRLAWFYTTGRWPERQIDHINGERTDNRICNLREASQGENNQNLTQLHRQNTSGFTGVSWHKAAKKWSAHINANKVRQYLGLFHTKEEAYAAYCSAKKRLHTFQPEPKASGRRSIAGVPA